MSAIRHPDRKPTARIRARLRKAASMRTIIMPGQYLERARRP